MCNKFNIKYKEIYRILWANCSCDQYHQLLQIQNTVIITRVMYLTESADLDIPVDTRHGAILVQKYLHC